MLLHLFPAFSPSHEHISKTRVCRNNSKQWRYLEPYILQSQVLRFCFLIQLFQKCSNAGIIIKDQNARGEIQHQGFKDSTPRLVILKKITSKWKYICIYIQKIIYRHLISSYQQFQEESLYLENRILKTITILNNYNLVYFPS